MAQIYTAFASEVKVNEETIEGLQSIEYQMSKNRQHVGAIGLGLGDLMTDSTAGTVFGGVNASRPALAVTFEEIATPYASVTMTTTTSAMARSRIRPRAFEMGRARRGK